MKARTRLQLRLQATVEGLSAAAITHYVAGVFGYLAKAAHDSGILHVEPSVATAMVVPIAGYAIAWTVRRIAKTTSPARIEVPVRIVRRSCCYSSCNTSRLVLRATRNDMRSPSPQIY
jgi:hypothetical protein